MGKDFSCVFCRTFKRQFFKNGSRFLPVETSKKSFECKGPAKRMQHHPTLLNPTLLDNVAQCWTRWPNECNMLDSTFGLERSGSKIYPESLENKRAPYWFAQTNGARSIDCEEVFSRSCSLEMLKEEDDRVTKRGKTRYWIK